MFRELRATDDVSQEIAKFVGNAANEGSGGVAPFVFEQTLLGKINPLFLPLFQSVQIPQAGRIARFLHDLAVGERLVDVVPALGIFVSEKISDGIDVTVVVRGDEYGEERNPSENLCTSSMPSMLASITSKNPMANDGFEDGFSTAARTQGCTTTT